MNKRMKSPPGAPASEVDTTSTMLISNRELNLDGVTFQWWAVGEHPSLVTVRSSVFGTLAEFTRDDPERFATGLAKKILAQHYERAAALRKTSHKTLEPERRAAFDSTEIRPVDRDALPIALEIEDEGSSENRTRSGSR